MRPTCLVFLACAVPAICSVGSAQQRQLAYKDIATSISYTEPANTTDNIVSAMPSTNIDTTNTSKTISTAAADLPAPALDKSMFSLIVFGVAGLCLL
ncbi:hypothetical protein PGQ11_008342 [Apiospora arundinis]|uniref:Uncharacterized protein n=1 Tax=Apiospora arundinis TaxID=335852 RepID=A0ABR2IFK0_9PEZI